MADGEATAQTTKPKSTTKSKNKGTWKRKSFAKRQLDARAWLERLVPPERITDARVNQLAHFVDRYRPGSKFQVLADAMVKNDEIRTIKKVAARYESRKNAYLRRNAPIAPVDLTPAIVDQLTTLIRASWDRRAHGPTWTEIRTVMGWDAAKPSRPSRNSAPADSSPSPTTAVPSPSPAKPRTTARQPRNRPDAVTVGLRTRKKHWTIKSYRSSETAAEANSYGHPPSERVRMHAMFKESPPCESCESRRN
ncbi:hypothetical protein [Paenarthrobacter sp. YIM B13468]|uniref:hypothetical protein n=1 Tax=Paenarthrobacter sp. YIM B13468 TaxID=3366295 RepID=UPI003672996D